MEEVTLRCAARVYGGGYAAHTMRIGKGPAGLRLEGFAASDREVSLRARVRSALRAGGFEVPGGVLATLDPPLGRRELPGSLGLPLAAGILAASGQIPADGIGMRVWSGELAPDGGVRLASPAAVSQLGDLRPGGLAGVRRDPAEGVWPLLGDADGKVVGLMDVGFVDDPESPSGRTRLFSQLGWDPESLSWVEVSSGWDRGPLDAAEGPAVPAPHGSHVPDGPLFTFLEDARGAGPDEVLGLLGRDAGAPGGAGGCETDVRDGAPKVWPVFVDRTQTVQVYVAAESLEEAWERAHEALRDPDTVERVCLMLDDSCNSDIDISVDDRPCDPADVDRGSLVGPRPAALAGAVVAEEGPRAAGSAREAFERSLAAAAAPGAGAARGRTM